ncbi:TRAP transporter substrate-binding protein [Sporosarcina sp. FA9]|uniref:TRAP transporter substrate-binding protein n=1 Tax=Sporosarcina sp. FA9 TaxID=3413030 RepID=UPI003F655278
MKKYIRIPFILLAVIFTTIGCSEESSEKETIATIDQNQAPIEWRLQSSWPAGIEIQRQADSFAEKVTEMSGGRLNITSLPSGSVVGGLEVFDAAENGVIDVAHSASFYWIGKEPVAPLFAAIPAGLSPTEYIMWLYHGDGLDLWKEMYKDYNFGFVGAAGMNNTEIFAWSNKPIESLDDFKGLKFRTVGIWGEILAKLGASVMTLPGAEIYGALDSGVIDAAEFANPESDYITGMHEVAKYAHVPGIHQPTSMMEILINKDSWDKLTPDLQKIVEEAAKATTIEGLGNSLAKDADALKKFVEHGTEIIRLSPEFIEDISEVAHDLYKEKSKADPFFKKVYESQMETRDAFRYLQDYMEIKY